MLLRPHCECGRGFGVGFGLASGVGFGVAIGWVVEDLLVGFNVETG